MKPIIFRFWFLVSSSIRFFVFFKKREPEKKKNVSALHYDSEDERLPLFSKRISFFFFFFFSCVCAVHKTDTNQHNKKKKKKKISQSNWKEQNKNELPSRRAERSVEQND